LDTGSSTVSVAAAGSVSAIAEQEKKFHQFEGVARQLNGGRTGLRETWLAVNPAAE